MFENKYFIGLRQTMNDAIENIKADISEGVSFKKYRASRTALNTLIFEAVTGSEMTNSSGAFECKFNKRLPNFDQVIDVANMLDRFITEVENPYLSLLNDAIKEKNKTTGDDEDLNIPGRENVVNANGGINFSKYYRSVPSIQKPTNKELKRVFSNKRNFIDSLMRPQDVYVLYEIGKKARADANFKKGIIIGGISVAVAGCAIGALAIKKKKDKEMYIENEEVTPALENSALGLRSELSDIDIPMIQYTESIIPTTGIDTNVSVGTPTYDVENNAL